MLSKGYKVAAPGACVAALCFFLPWFFVSCSGQPVRSFSGLEFATGTEVNGQRISGSPELFLVLLCSLVVLTLAYFAWRRGHATTVEGVTLLGLGTLPLVLLWLKSFDAQSNMPSGLQITEIQYGFWGTILGNIIVMVGGALNLIESSQPSLPPNEGG